MNYDIEVYDPHVIPDSDLERSIDGSDLIVILSDHDEFKEFDFDLIREKMNSAIIFDTKNIVKDVPEDIRLINYGNL